MSRLILAGLAGALMMTATPMAAEAGCGGGGGGYYGGHYRASYSYTPTYYTPKVYYHRPVVVHKPIVVHKPVVVADHCFHPKHCYVWVQPGESLDHICLREYGDSTLWRKVARYNSLAHGAALDCHRPLMLPSIYSSGRMMASTAPAPAAPIAVEAAPAIASAAPPAAPPAAL